ncbi:MAG: hypothetical protein DMG65_22215 [Candidatus Angelobacter sp. Gp1-AA117]|nr:MAG: hypothetical protein DMG65_22215 [Candidatus Angelobacter sp. Gp1-AA117]
MADLFLMTELAFADAQIKKFRDQIRRMKGPGISDKMWNLMVRDEDKIEDSRNELEKKAADLEVLRRDLAEPITYGSNDVEERIKAINQELTMVLRAYTVASRPMGEQITEHLGLRIDDQSAKFVELLASREKTVVAHEIGISLTGLALYRYVTESHALQDIRDLKVEQFTDDVAKWDVLKIKTEIRKRTNERNALPDLPLPRVKVFSTRDLSLRDPFSRQRIFLDKLISSLEELEKGKHIKPPVVETKREQKSKIEAEMIDLDRQITTIESSNMSEDMKRRLTNSIHKKKEQLHEEWEKCL